MRTVFFGSMLVAASAATSLSEYESSFYDDDMMNLS